MRTNVKRGRTSAQDKYDNANVETISFKARKGSRKRIVGAAQIMGQSTNGFIRVALNKAVQDATGEPMEYMPDEQGGKSI